MMGMFRLGSADLYSNSGQMMRRTLTAISRKSAFLKTAMEGLMFPSKTIITSNIMGQHFLQL
ncbi:hypothetical protein B6V71_11875 [Escherichia coli]|nr:hypothetical protein [Escherichia coli]